MVGPAFIPNNLTKLNVFGQNNLNKMKLQSSGAEGEKLASIFIQTVRFTAFSTYH